MIDLGEFAAELPALQPGTVWLAGAGPGDPGLLSLMTVHALQQADVIVYDALVGERILAFARPEAAKEFAGKRGGKPSPHQRDITDRLIELAKSRQRVLRLKGGDPFVFGRGAEEALGLVAAGVPFRVVPGLTSGLAGLAAAGIPATSRLTNQAVTLVTGHGAEGEERVDWQGLARTNNVLVLYMAMARLPVIVPELIAGGLTPDTAVAVVTEATLPGQRTLVTTLARVVDDVAAAGMAAPAIIAIGAVASLRAQFADLMEGIAG
jgi:uroporphyrin-III C-methyltransferase